MNSKSRYIEEKNINKKSNKNTMSIKINEIKYCEFVFHFFFVMKKNYQ